MKRFLPFLALFSLVFLMAFSCEEAEEVAVVDTPAGFAELRAQGQFAAMSPEGMVFRIRAMKNSPPQTLQFWSEALQHHLEQEGYVAVSTDNEFTAGDAVGLYAEWSVPYGPDTHKYLTAILVDEEVITVAETSGVHDVYAQHRDAVIESLGTITFAGLEPDVYSSVQVQSVMPPTVERRQGAQPVAEDRSGCFVAGTPVWTTNGLVAIDAVWPGTMMPVYDAETDAWTERFVERIVELEYSGQVMTVVAADAVLEVTARHPFLVRSGDHLETRVLPDELPMAESISPAEGRWIEAEDLRVGDVLFARNGVGGEVTSVASERRTELVYHLHMSGPHTYAVSTPGVVVHNGASAEDAGEGYKAPVESTHVAREREIIGQGAIAASLPQDARDERVRVYSGACSVLVDRVEESKREVSDMAEAAGGFVEQSSDERIVIRVPAADFRAIFDGILGLGETLYKAIETYDVTDQFTDPSGRLAVAIRARDRLYVLLERVEDPAERLEILKQIRDYTETIERLQLSLQVLEQRIAMSRITVEFHSRLAQVAFVDRPIPFAWIANLHPLYDTTANLNDAAIFALPGDVAVFENEGVLRAEAADGTRVRAGTVINDPRGDSLFWQRAVSYHLGPRYEEAEEIDAGGMKLTLLTSKDTDPFYFLTGAIPAADPDRLVVVEAYFPDQAALDRHYDDLLLTFREVDTP